MGVRGLRAFLNFLHVGGHVSELRPENVVLLVDGVGFVMGIVEGMTGKYKELCNWELGGCYRLIHSEILAEIEKLLEQGFHLRFFFDGSSSCSPIKTSTLNKRMLQREEKWLELYNAVMDDDSAQKIPPQERLPLPYLVVNELKTVLQFFPEDCVVVNCEGEADQEISLACIEGNSASATDGLPVPICRNTFLVYTGDTDFLFFPDTPTVFFDTLESSGIDGKLVRAPVWRRDALAEDLGFPSQELLVEFSILVGNDATGHFRRSLFDTIGGEDSSPIHDADEDVKVVDGWAPLPTSYRPSLLDCLRKQLLAAGSVRLSSSKSIELQTAIDYSRAFYAMEDVSVFANDNDSDRETESMSLSSEQKEDIKLYTEASTTEIVTTCGLDVIVYLQQAEVFEDEISMLHIKGYEMMLEALAEAHNAEVTSGKFDHPLVPRPPRIKWANIRAAQVFQRAFHEFIKNSERHPEGPMYDLSLHANSPSAVYDGHVFHAIMLHLQEEEDKEAKGKAGSVAPQIPLATLSSGADILPIDQHRERILAQIAKDRVTIIHGETGCGKSSRLPAMLLEHAELTGQNCKMFVSQPRRIAASSLMKRLRTTLGDKVGLRMGHGIIDEKADTKITFVTTGYIVRLLANYPDAFATHSHLIIDEVHERSVDGDVLCLLARRLLQINPTIRLILMSATVHTILYKDYFTGRGEYYGDMEVLSVGVRRFPVNIHYIEDIDCNPAIPSALKKLSCKKIGELTSGRTKGRGDEQVPQAMAKEQYAVAYTLIRTLGKLGTGVLVFVSGLNDITEIMEKFEGLTRYKLVAIHSDIPFEEQEAAFEPTPADQVKVVIATNAAESSITLPDVDLVICLGTHKALRYNAGSHRVQLVNTWISKASATQRAGRTGRVRPGVVYRLYSRALFNGFDEHEQSEVHRKPLQDVILDLRTMLEDSAGFKGVVPLLEDLLEPPETDNVGKSFDYLHRAGMITQADDDGRLTSIGRLAGSLPVDLKLGCLIAMGITLGVGTEAAILASALSQPKSPFRLASPMIHTNPDEYNDIILQTFVGASALDDGQYSEPIMMLRMFILWYNMDHAERNDWCSKHGLAHVRVRQFVSSSTHLIERVNSGLSTGKKREGGRGSQFAKNKDVLSLDDLPHPDNIDNRSLTIYRLILTWTADGNVVRMNPQKKQLTSADYSSVTFTGVESLTKAHLSSLFPDSIDWKFDCNMRRLYDAPISPSRKACSPILLIRDLASSLVADISSNQSAMVWIIQQKEAKVENGSSLILAVSKGEEFAGNLNIIKVR